MNRYFELKRSMWKMLPYIYFIGLAAFWFFGEISVRQHFSYFALGVMLFLAVQAVIQNRIVGASLGLLAIAINVLFFLAVISEFNDFDSISGKALQLIAVGSTLAFSGIAMGVMLTTSNVKTMAQ